MKRQLGSRISTRSKKIACTVSAAALMLGVSSAATVGLHFQENYSCRNAAYSGYPVTLTAFGIESNAWENLYEMENGYGGCPWTAPGYTTNEVIDTDTSTNGLNPLPNGSLSVTWFGNSANFDPFYGYAGSPPYYTGGGPLRNPKTGEQQIYATFIRDGINYGPPGSADNPLKDYYYVDVTGLKSLFTNSSFVVELIASGDSINRLTNAFVIDLANMVTNSVSYPNIPPVGNAGGAPWLRGNGGGLSTGSAPLNTDHIYIVSNIPQHGTNGNPGGFDNAGTISGFIITDQPVVSMSPQSVPVAGPGDTVVLSAYAIGVPPLSYQWQLNGSNISGANTLTNTIASVGAADSGSYTLIVSNAYGVATSQVATVTVDQILLSPTASNDIVFDSNTNNPQHDGINSGATWQASNTSGTITRTGVMSFDAQETNGITVPDNAAFDGPTGTITLWMQSPGTDLGASGNFGAALVARPINGSSSDEFALAQSDGGNLQFLSPTSAGASTTVSVSDGKWHFVALTFNDATNGYSDLYVDGTLAGTNNNGGTGWSGTSGLPLDIGNATDGYFRGYNGLLDDVRFYSVALTASQINSIYTSANGAALVDPTDLQLQFNFTTPPGQGIILSWLESTAGLQSAPTVTGPWTPITGAASPYTIVPNATQQFFRYVSTNGPQTHISNPYLM